MNPSSSRLPPVRIGRDDKRHLPLGLGGSHYGLDHRRREGEAGIVAALEAALDAGITHFDTATDYDGGESERRLGRFLAAGAGRRECVFLASKANLDEVSARAAVAAVDASLARLRVEVIDLYYLHWPRGDRDLRPWMEGLEAARQQGKIRSIGVSNFSIAQMKQLGEAGRIDACQLGYNLLWRFPEADLIPYCTAEGIDVIAYSALAHGILAGKYGRWLAFTADDQRWTISLFRDDVWPRVHDAANAMRHVANHAGLPLAQLALRWLLSRPGVTAALVSARNPEQVLSAARALSVDIPDGTLDELTVISDRVASSIPDEGNPFGYHP